MHRSSAIPVLMYHSVGKVIPGWKWSYLTVSPAVFEDHLRWLKKKGFKTIDLDQLYDHVSGRQVLSSDHVVLTFDDGYLDNWTHAAPLLRKYGFKAVVYVNPDFVDPVGERRPTLENVWSGDIQEGDLLTDGFMSWAELQSLSEEGVFSVQSHLMTHTWYPVSERIVDFHHPGDDYYWLDWNHNPQNKPFYLRNPGMSNVPFGWPIYENAKSVLARRFCPDAREGAALAEFVHEKGENDFFLCPDWRNKLQKVAENYRKNSRVSVRVETDEEYLARITYEIHESRKIIEEKMHKPVEFLGWPGGGYDELSVSCALTVYKAVTLGSRDSSGVRNRTGEDPRFEKRCGVPYIESNGKVLYQGGRYLIHYLREFQGSLVHRKARQLMKLYTLLALRVGILQSDRQQPCCTSAIL